MTTGEDRNKDRFKNWKLCSGQVHVEDPVQRM